MRSYPWTCLFQCGFCIFKYKGSMVKTPNWSRALTHCPHYAVNVLVYLPILQISSWESEDIISQGDSVGGMELRFRSRFPDLCWGNPPWALESKGQPWLHGLGIIGCLSSSGPRSSDLLVWMYFMMVVNRSPPEGHSDKSQALVPLEHHPSKYYCCTIYFPLGIASHASNRTWVLQLPCFLLFSSLSLLSSAVVDSAGGCPESRGLFHYSWC